MLLAGSMLGLAACGNGETAGGQDPGAAPGGGGDGQEPVTMTFAWWGGTERTRLTNETVDLFEELHPNITVRRESTDFDPYWERVSVQAAGGNLPDALQMQTRLLAEYAPRGVLLGLDEYVESGAIDVSTVPDVILDSGRLGGELWMVPTGIAYHTLYFNADLLEQAGIPVPEPGWNWQDLADLLVEWSGSLPEGSYATTNLGSDFPSMYTYFASNGLNVFTAEGGLGFQPEDVAEWFSYWEDLRMQGATLPADLQAQELPAGIENSWIVRGIAGMSQIPANQLQAHRDSTDATIAMVRFPQGTAGQGTMFVNSGMSVSANSPNPQAGVEWVDYFTNNVEAGLIYQADNGIPSSSEIQDALLESGQLSPGQVENFELYRDLVEEVANVPVFPPGERAIVAALERTYEELAFGQSSVSEAANTFWQEADRVTAPV